MRKWVIFILMSIFLILAVAIGKNIDLLKGIFINFPIDWIIAFIVGAIVKTLSDYLATKK